MRIPHVHNLQLDPSERRSEETVKVNILPEPYLDDLGLFEDKREESQWILRTKRIIHHCWEYEELVKFLKHKCGMSRCGIHPNLSIYDGHSIEVHHTPFTITDIITIVTKKHLVKNESLKQTDIVREIMELHYLGLVGLYPLCAGLCHSLAHADDNQLFVPLDVTFGSPEKFVEIYHPFMTEVMKDKWATIVNLNKGYGIINNTLPLALQKKYIYIESEDGSFTNQISTTKLKDFIIQLNAG